MELLFVPDFDGDFATDSEMKQNPGLCMKLSSLRVGIEIAIEIEKHIY